MTPQAILAPEFPAGSLIPSSGFAWITKLVPFRCSREWRPSRSVTEGRLSVMSTRPFEGTSRLGRSPACGPSGFSNPCFLPNGLKWPPALWKLGVSHNPESWMCIPCRPAGRLQA